MEGYNMDSATFAALTNYSTVAAALAAKPADGQAWLLNDTQIFQDGTMPKSGPASVKNNRQTQLASTLTPTIQRNRGQANTTGGSWQSSKGGGTFVNRETVSNTKTPAIGTSVSWFVTDSTQTNGYRRVFGLLE